MYNLTGLLKDVTPSEQTVYAAHIQDSENFLIGREVADIPVKLQIISVIVYDCVPEERALYLVFEIDSCIY